ncbi:MAG: hypothetical protein DHS20C10_08900 [marine bacterium B5-7]|nr:MAG: hypothetical protein DHS20C10_08900 [marine bacterium B5-7]
MKTKSFDAYLEKRLDKAEIKQIERLAKREKKLLERLQSDVASAVASYMEEEGIGFNELVRRLDTSPTQVSNIIHAKANLTLASIAHIFALLNRKPHIVFGE